MEKMPTIKLENKTISKEESFELAPKLFQPIGQEVLKSHGRLEIENENLKMSIRYEDIKFSIDNIPKNEEEMLDTNLSIGERNLLRFLDFKLEDFYEMRHLLIENKHDFNNIELEEYDTRQTRIFVRKNGTDLSGSLANPAKNFIKLNAEPKTAAAILAVFHEIGHIKDPNFDRLDMLSSMISGKDTDVENKKIIDRERYAWAYSLSKLKPFFEGMGIDQKDLNTFVHERCLGSYSDSIKNNI